MIIHINNFKEECDDYLTEKEKKNVQYVIDSFDRWQKPPCMALRACKKDSEFESIQKDNIKLIIYNNRDKITNQCRRDLEIIV
jgi:hypothetical protein